MAKAPAPKTKVEAPAEEAPTLNIAEIAGKLAPHLETARDSENQKNQSLTDFVLDLIETVDDAGGKEKVDRADLKLVVQTALSVAYGVPLQKVQNRPNKPGEKRKDAGDATLYSLASRLLTMAWPSGELEQKKLEKFLTKTERENVTFDTLRIAASKPAKKRTTDDSKMTLEDLAAKVAALMALAETAGLEIEEIRDTVTDTAEVYGTEPDAEPDAEKE